MAIGVTAVVAAGCGGEPGAQHKRSTGQAAAAALANNSSGQVGAFTYQSVCQSELAVCAQAPPAGSVPATIVRPLHLPHLRRGQPCPATFGAPIGNRYVAGLALGRGPVRPLIASEGDVRHGIAYLDPAGVHGWREFKTLWFSMPSYQGPILIRARRIDGAEPIRLGGSGGLPATARPLIVPPGPTANGGGGWRTAPGGTWARSSGCYAWQVDGTTFSEMIVVHAKWLPRRRPDRSS